ncbi:MAG: hypothetical protein R8J85_09720 [Mariprofundales bacterium]
MATTYDEIIGFLNEKEIKFTDKNESDQRRIITYFATDEENEEDDIPEIVFIQLSEDGEFIRFYEPERYKYADGKHKVKVLETLLAIQWESKMLQWEYDPTDGEIRACIELPLEDAVLTQRLFFRALFGLVQLMDHYHPRIKCVMETGEDPGQPKQQSGFMDRLEALAAKLRETTGEEVPKEI